MPDLMPAAQGPTMNRRARRSLTNYTRVARLFLKDSGFLDKKFALKNGGIIAPGLAIGV